VPAKMEKIQIAGVKLSGELLQVNISGFSHALDAKRDLSQLLSANQINMQFLSGVCLRGRSQATCCVRAEKEGRVRDNAEFVPSVGLLSLFPHQFSLKILGLSLFAVGAAGVALHGMSSSLSALTLVTDYVHLNKAVAALQEYLNMPVDKDTFNPDPFEKR
jgi:hypothetical protein